MRTDVTTERATVNVQSVVLFNKCYSKCYTPSINCKYVSYMHEYGPGAMGAARRGPAMSLLCDRARADCIRAGARDRSPPTDPRRYTDTVLCANIKSKYK